MKKDQVKNACNNPRIWIVDVLCPKCGKIFVPAPYHVFRDKLGWYCSWTCFNHREEV